MAASYHREELESGRLLTLVVAAIDVWPRRYVATEMKLRTQPLHGAASVNQRADFCTLLDLCRPSLCALPVEMLRVIQPTKEHLAHAIARVHRPVTVLLKGAEREEARVVKIAS